MEFKTATMADFDVAFDYIEKLWTYNTYDKEVIRKVYADVLADENSFAFFLMDGADTRIMSHQPNVQELELPGAPFWRAYRPVASATNNIYYDRYYAD